MGAIKKFCSSKIAITPHLKKASFLDPIYTTIGKICFSTKKDRNYKFRSLFIEKITTVSPVISYWNGLFRNSNWKKIWSLQHKYFLTNKVKEVSFKLINKSYPVKQFMEKYKANIDTKC